MNHCSLMGRLTADAELRTFNNNGNEGTVASFTVAVNRRGKDAGTDFIRCSAFNSTAQFISKYFHKGDMIAIDGRITVNTKNNEDGTRTSYTSVTVDNAYFCGGKNNGNSGSAPTDNSSSVSVNQESDELDSLPF